MFNFRIKAEMCKWSIQNKSNFATAHIYTLISI